MKRKQFQSKKIIQGKINRLNAELKASPEYHNLYHPTLHS